MHHSRIWTFYKDKNNDEFGSINNTQLEVGFRHLHGVRDLLERRTSDPGVATPFSLAGLIEGWLEFAHPIMWDLCPYPLQQVKHIFSVCWALLWERRVSSLECQNCLSALCRWRGSVTFSMHWGDLYPYVRRSKWESAPQVWNHGSFLENGGLQVGNEMSPQVKEFNRSILFTSEGKLECGNYRRTDATSAVMWSLYQAFVAKSVPSQKAKLSIYQSTYVPSLTSGHEL